MADPRLRQQFEQLLLGLRPHRRAADFDIAQVLAGVAQAVLRHPQDQIEAGGHEGQPGSAGVEELFERHGRIAHSRQQQQAVPGLGHRPQSPQAEGMAQRQRHEFQVVAASTQKCIDIQGCVGDVGMR